MKNPFKVLEELLSEIKHLKDELRELRYSRNKPKQPGNDGTCLTCGSQLPRNGKCYNCGHQNPFI